MEKRRIYLMGICGTGMAALAGLLKEQGHEVTGSDTGFYPPMSEVIASLGIKTYKGWSPVNIEDADPDLVIIGNVIRADNPEARYVLEKAIPYTSFPAALGEFYLAGKRSLVAAGTHGKTTTSTMLVSALEGCGEDAGFLIGGVPIGRGRGFHVGEGDWFVIEGDEYDTAFFDKVSKFLHYRPFGVILTSMEFDHADIFADFHAVKSAFRSLVEIIPEEGCLAACADWPDVMDVASAARCRVITYGLGAGADWRAEGISTDGSDTWFKVSRRGEELGRFSIRLPGRHNVANALGVMALLSELGFDLGCLSRGLASCPGVKRRQEVRGEAGGVLVIDDFAHHPTAVKETLSALRARYPERRLIAIFEPRTNTSRRAVFQQRYAAAFDHADLVLVREVPDPEKAPEGDRFSSSQLVKDLRARSVEARYFPDAAAIVDFLGQAARPGDLCAVLSNGPFEGIHQRILDTMSKRGAGRGVADDIS